MAELVRKIITRQYKVAPCKGPGMKMVVIRVNNGKLYRYNETLPLKYHRKYTKIAWLPQTKAQTGMVRDTDAKSGVVNNSCSQQFKLP